MLKEQRFDCIVIGAGPGGLQGAIHLARFNRRVLILDRGGGRTRHAHQIVNFLGIPSISGLDLIRIGFLQARSFGVEVKSRTAVTKLSKRRYFKVETESASFFSPFVLVSSGAREQLPPIGNLAPFFGNGFYTCVDCDGHHTTGTQLVVITNSLDGVRLALGMKKMYTERLTLLLDNYSPPGDFQELLLEDCISVIKGRPAELLGDKRLSGIRLDDGRTLPCQTIMSSYGWELNDQYLQGLPLERDAAGFKILANPVGESSLPGLFITGALRASHAQAIIAAGQGALAAIEINARLLGL